MDPETRSEAAEAKIAPSPPPDKRLYSGTSSGTITRVSHAFPEENRDRSRSHPPQHPFCPHTPRLSGTVLSRLDGGLHHQLSWGEQTTHEDGGDTASLFGTVEDNYNLEGKWVDALSLHPTQDR